MTHRYCPLSALPLPRMKYRALKISRYILIPSLLFIANTTLGEPFDEDSLLRQLKNQNNALKRNIDQKKQILREKERKRQKQITRELRLATEATIAGELVTPETGALAYYRNVLKLDADNPDALAGLESLFSTLLSGSRAFIKRQQWDQAREKLEDAEKIFPNTARLREARAELSKAIAEFEEKRRLRPIAESDIDALIERIGKSAIIEFILLRKEGPMTVLPRKGGRKMEALYDGSTKFLGRPSAQYVNSMTILTDLSSIGLNTVGDLEDALD
jgi:tetratricopeptide (TPR) repeat protein